MTSLEITKIIFELSSIPILIWSSGTHLIFQHGLFAHNIRCVFKLYCLNEVTCYALSHMLPSKASLSLNVNLKLEKEYKSEYARTQVI